MSRPIEKILIVAKHGDENATAIRAEMVPFLEAAGVAVETCEHLPAECEKPGVVDGVDLVIVLGGDGTFIGVARRLHHLGAPLMGVNLGRVGFLAQLRRDRWQEWLESVLADGFRVSKRLALEYEVFRSGSGVHSGLVINDLVVSRGELARLIQLKVSYDDMSISSMRADGLIVSTPTGSSAYGVSAGGPLVHTGLRAFCVTPVCPFLSSFKPMVFPAEGVLSIQVEERGGEVNLTEDGQSVVKLEYGDEIVLRQAAKDLLVVDLGQQAYFDKLKKHGFLTEK